MSFDHLSRNVDTKSLSIPLGFSDLGDSLFRPAFTHIHHLWILEAEGESHSNRLCAALLPLTLILSYNSLLWCKPRSYSDLRIAVSNFKLLYTQKCTSL